jgi:hypothetical protein
VSDEDDDVGDPNVTTLPLGELKLTLLFNCRSVLEEERCAAARMASSGSPEERDEACPSLETAFLFD